MRHPIIVINSNLPPVLHRFHQVMADYWSNFR